MVYPRYQSRRSISQFRPSSPLYPWTINFVHARRSLAGITKQANGEYFWHWHPLLCQASIASCIRHVITNRQGSCKLPKCCGSNQHNFGIQIFQAYDIQSFCEVKVAFIVNDFRCTFASSSSTTETISTQYQKDSLQISWIPVPGPGPQLLETLVATSYLHTTL